MRWSARPPRAFLALAVLFVGACGGAGSEVAGTPPPPLQAAVTGLSLPADPEGVVSLSVTLTTSEPATLDLQLEVSVDGGLTWRPATAPERPGGFSADPNGRTHAVMWDSVADIGFRSFPNARLRATPTHAGGSGTSMEIPVPAIDNLQAAAQRVDHYFIHYGAFDDDTTRLAETYQLVILHPFTGGVPVATVRDIQDGVDPDDPADDVIVLAYISVGEDLRTIGMDDNALLADPRFVGDASGPRVDPRGPNADGQPITGLNPLGSASNGGTGFASWYLDDNSVDRDPNDIGDGSPDRNGIFGGCFVNAGDPAWFDVLDQMTFDGIDGMPGMGELLTSTTGRGYACDGLFLDTIDTCAPNHFTDAQSVNQSEFEWTAGGFRDFIARLRTTYPDSLILQNRGLFLLDPRHPHYAVTTRASVDFVLLESYRLNSNEFEEFDPLFFPDNKYNTAPKLMAEANRPDGFKVLSLGYAEGPATEMDVLTLVGHSDTGLASLLTDIQETQDLAGFRHYLTDGGVAFPNDFVRMHTDLSDTTPPTWTSTWNDNAWPFPQPPGAPTPRVGIQELLPGPGRMTVRWDVALDLHRVGYALYYATQPLDFQGDPTLSSATRVVLTANPASNYASAFGPSGYANEFTLDGLTNGTTYHFCIRAFDSKGNEEQNAVSLSGAPTGQATITIDGAFADWLGVPLAHEDPADVPDSSGADWRRIWIANDAQNLYIRYTSDNAFNLDGSPAFPFSRTMIFVDVDNDPATGYSGGASEGSELLVFGTDLYEQALGVFNNGHLGALSVAPATNAVEVELAIPLAQIYARAPDASQLRLRFLNDEVADRAPDTGALTFTIITTP